MIDADPSTEPPPSPTLDEAAEAIIFAADEPVAPDRIAEIVADVTGRSQPSDDEVAAAVDRLNDAYA